MRGTELLIRSELKGAKSRSLPSSSSILREKKNGQREKKEHLIKIFKMEQHETDLPPCEKKKKIHTLTAKISTVCREYQKKKKRVISFERNG